MKTFPRVEERAFIPRAIWTSTTAISEHRSTSSLRYCHHAKDLPNTPQIFNEAVLSSLPISSTHHFLVKLTGRLLNSPSAARIPRLTTTSQLQTIERIDGMGGTKGQRSTWHTTAPTQVGRSAADGIIFEQKCRWNKGEVLCKRRSYLSHEMKRRG